MIGSGLLVSLLVAYPCETSPAARTAGAPKPQGMDQRTGSAAADGGKRCVHQVRRGESMSVIATRYRTTPQALTAANYLSRSNSLHVGHRLTIPGCTSGLQRSAVTPPGDGEARSSAAQAMPERSSTGSGAQLTSRHGRGAFVSPVQGHVTSRFGRRGLWSWHRGVDIKAPRGAPIRAAAAGTVVFSGWQSGYGRVIKIAHPDGFITIYAHNQRNLVLVGDRVRSGTVIGTVGRTGRSTGNHVHFEIRRQGLAQNPGPFLARPEPEHQRAPRKVAQSGGAPAHSQPDSSDKPTRVAGK